MKRIGLRNWLLAVLLLVLPVGMTVFLWDYATQAEQWALHRYNPQVYRGGVPARGCVTDREGRLLRSYSRDIFSENEELRRCFVHWVGDRQGNIPALAATGYRKELAGYDPIDGLYRYANADVQITLTLSAPLQQAALEAMEGYQGTLALYDYKTGEILCALSMPCFDPLQPPYQPQNGEYLNRFLQGRYTPGSIFKIVTTAAALETENMDGWRYTCTGSHAFGTERVTCPRAHGTVDLKAAMMHSCNCAYAQLANQLGAERLKSCTERFGVLRQLTFDGINCAKGYMQMLGQSPVDVAWSAIGQHKDLVNPCAFLCFVGAVANGGRGMQPYIVERAGNVYRAAERPAQRILSEKTAATLREYMANNVSENYGAEQLSGFHVCAKTGTAQVGKGEKPHALLTGFLQDAEHPYAFIIVAENAGSGKKICMPILAKLLEAIKKAPPA